MPPQSPLRALPTLISPNGVCSVTAGSEGQELVNLNPPVDARNGAAGVIGHTLG